MERKNCHWQEARILWRSTTHCYDYKIWSHIWRIFGQALSCNSVREIIDVFSSDVYLVAKEYKVLLITDQEPLERAFIVITPLGNSLELYIDARVDNAPRHSANHLSVDSSRPVQSIIRGWRNIWIAFRFILLG